jgi:hypothetical protein
VKGFEGMKRSHIIVINTIFFGLMIFSAGVVYQFLTGNKPLQALSIFSGARRPVAITTNACSDKPAIEKLDGSGDAQLQKLRQYQDACHSFATNTMMTFVSMPVSQSDAVQRAQEIIPKLKAFAKYGVRPLIIVEPTDANGNNLDFAVIANGGYDAPLDAYFAKLKSAGIPDQQMGIWNPLPEANLPYWSNNEPKYFAPSVNRFVAIARKYFPKVEISVMLNSATYETTDFNWENGDYESLNQYVKGIAPGTINYAGLQGFPWSAPQGGTATIFNAAEFLNPSLLSEMADTLKTKNVWFNTGTYSTKYALDPARIVDMSPEQRKEIIDTIAIQAEVLKSKGYNVAVNIFAKDKSKASEETNWSYWSGGQPFASSSTPVLTEFISDLNKNQIPFWLFDN